MTPLSCLDIGTVLYNYFVTMFSKMIGLLCRWLVNIENLDFITDLILLSVI